MTIHNATTSKLANVPTGSTGCSDFGAMAVSGQKAWALKTKSDNSKSNLLIYNNITQSYTSNHIYNNTFGHGNGMTSTTNYIYFACWPQSMKIIRLKKSDLSSRVDITTPTHVTSLAYYGNSQFIVHPNSGGDSTHLYYAIGKNNISGSTGTMQYLSYFYVDISASDFSGYNTGQDIHYDTSTSLLFIPRCKNNNGSILQNKIAVVNLAGSYTTYNNCKCYTPFEVIVVDKSGNSDYTKFEVESLGIDNTRHIVMACNVEGNYTDSFHKITNLTF